jgi:hypothetical protein
MDIYLISSVVISRLTSIITSVVIKIKRFQDEGGRNTEHGTDIRKQGQSNSDLFGFER